jgi:pimeloyl-ACP methyl ester carboxylesterase
MDPSMFINMICRPPRSGYPEALGKTTTCVKEKNYKHDQFKIKNPKGEDLCVSFVEPAYDDERPAEEMPCIIYMHGNASNKQEGLQYINEIVPLGINLCCFDFSGCGNSQGDWVTLGHKERDDLKAVIEYLYENKKVSSIGLWGRSMGAATSVFYESENPGTVNCMVLDSGFATLTKVVDSMAGQFGIPPEFVQMLLPQIDGAIHQQAGFHIADLDVTKAAAACEVPVFFCHGAEDTFVVPDNSQQNHDSYKGANKSIELVPGDHNAERPLELRAKIG